jgi:hypothetical protein
LILADHRRIGRLCHALYDTARYDDTPRPTGCLAMYGNGSLICW